jgi:hypothetical protein
MHDDRRQEGPRAYQIRVWGYLGEDWSHWFDGMAITVEDEESPAPVTTLSGVVADQSALRGILSAIWDLNLTLISVNPIERDQG